MAEISYLPICLITALRLGLISSLYFVFIIGLVIIMRAIIVDVQVRFTWWHWLASFGSTFKASVSIFHPRYTFENCPCSMKPYSSEI